MPAPKTKNLRDLAAQDSEYRQRARSLAPVDRCLELARAGVPPDEIAAALESEGHGPDLPVPLERIELEAATGRAYLRHALHLQSLSDPSAAAFMAKNTLGFTASALDREMAGYVKSLAGLTRAELLAKYGEIAERLGMKVVPAEPAGRVTQLGPGEPDDPPVDG